MNHPLVSVVLAYAAGLIIGQYWQVPPVSLFAAAFAALLLTLFVKKFRTPLLWILLALVGWTNYAVRTQVISPNDLRQLLPNKPSLATVRGKLCATPSQRVFLRDDVESWRTLAQLDVTEINCGKDWQAANGQIIVTTPGILPKEFFGGQIIEVSGVIATPAPPVAEGLLDYRTYLQRQAIYYELKCYSVNEWKLLSTSVTPPIADRFLAWSQITLARGLPETDEPLKLL